MKQNKRTERLGFRVTKSEAAKIRKFAKENGDSLSDCICSLIGEKLFYLDH